MLKHSLWLPLSPDGLLQRTVEKHVAPELSLGRKYERWKTGNPENGLGLRCVWRFLLTLSGNDNTILLDMFLHIDRSIRHGSPVR